MLAGPNEFVDPLTGKARSKNFRAIPEAFRLMDYDAGMLSSADKNYLSTHKLRAPASFTFPDHLTVRKLNLNGARIALFMLPECGAEDITKLADEISTKHMELRKASDIIIAISPLGLDLEKELLQKTDGLDILLGGGPGYGFSSRINSSGKTIWSRPFTRGKTLNIITLQNLPSGNTFTWDKGMNFQAEVTPLGDSIRQDPAVEQVLIPNGPANK